MADIIQLFEAHGLLSVFFGVLVEQLGAPIPAVPFLLLAGAQSATDGLFALKSLAAAGLASLIADSAWFLAGRRYGRSVLGLLCRVSISPGTCVQKSEISFARRGVLTILFAKFIPGVSTLSPPMAGAMRMPLLTFVLVDLAGTLLWAGSGLAAGLIFHRQVKGLMDFVDSLGSAALLVVLGALVLYVAWRVLHRVVVNQRLRGVRSVTPHALAEIMRRRENVVLLDVRPDGPFPLDRIPGARPAPLNGGVLDGLLNLQPGVPVITYCDCPNDASAARAALKLARQGHEVYVLKGGFAAWAAAGFEVAVEEHTDVPAALPRTSTAAGG